MFCFSQSHLTHEPTTFCLRGLTVQAVTSEEEKAKAKALLRQYHYLKDNAGKGRQAFQAIVYRGQWVAIFEWTSPAMHLKDRDEWIGWNPHMKSQRRELVINNSRFLILAQERMPNLASKSLALACKHISSLWKVLYGYEPLLAETFTDIEQYEGTCYKAAGWQELGMTQGYSKHGKEYKKHDRPKKLWVKTLCRNARRILTHIDLPDKNALAVNHHSPERALALRKPQLDSLMDLLRQIPDPRRTNRSFSKTAILTLVMMGLLAGKTNLAQIHRYASFLTTQQRKWIGFPPGKQCNYKPPSYNCIQNLLRKIDPHSLSDILNQWFIQNEGTLDEHLALDGKYISDQVLTVAMSAHESGSPHCMKIASESPKTEDNKKEGESTLAKEMFQEMDLSNKTITIDAMGNNQPITSSIIAGGGDYLIQIKNNYPTAYEYAKQVHEQGTPFLPAKVL